MTTMRFLHHGKTISQTLAAAGLMALCLIQCTPTVQASNDLGLLTIGGGFGNLQNRIGGTMLGLSGTIVISLNDGDDLTLTSDGTFTFPVNLNSGSTYLVAIRTQPTSPAEYCSVSGGSGLVSGTVSSVEVSCYQLPDTGQGTCYNAGGGIQSCFISPPSQDGAFVGNPAAIQFVAFGTGSAVRETSSTLLWQRCMFGSTWDSGPGTCQGTPQTLDQSSAAAYCAGLTLEGMTWRLPTIRELLLWPDYGLNRPTAQSILFPAIPVGSGFGYWSSTIDSTSPSQVFVLDPDDGLTANQLPSTAGYTRCVSGPRVPGNLFSDRGDGTILDRSTNLLWTKCSLENYGPPGMLNSNADCAGGGATDNWDSSLIACDSLTHAGRGDWRLPSVRELATLLKYDLATGPLIDVSFFQNSSSTVYWSSTSQDAAAANGWSVDFSNYTIGISSKGAGLRTRCVTTGL